MKPATTAEPPRGDMTTGLEPRERADRRDVALAARLPPPDLDHWGWQLHAACRGTDGADFFPPEREQEKSRSRRVAKAKAVCFRCPVMVQCRTYSISVGEPFGVWGGLSEEERARLTVLAGSVPGRTRLDSSSVSIEPAEVVARS